MQLTILLDSSRDNSCYVILTNELFPVYLLKFADYFVFLPHWCQIFTTLASKNEHMSTLNDSKNRKL